MYLQHVVGIMGLTGGEGRLLRLTFVLILISKSVCMRGAGTVRLEDVLASEYSSVFRMYLSEKGHQHMPKVRAKILPLESVFIIFLGFFLDSDINSRCDGELAKHAVQTFEL